MAKIDLTKYPPKEEQLAYLARWAADMEPIWELECQQYKMREAARLATIRPILLVAPVQ